MACDFCASESPDRKHLVAMRTPVNPMEGKTVVITGATSGIGRAVALQLARRGATLYLLSRNQRLGSSLARRLTAIAGAPANFIAVDLSSLDSVRNAAREVSLQCTMIHVLINNAGARFDRFAATPEDIERTFATNHLGHFLLTAHLLPLLGAAPEARVLSVSSSAAAAAREDGPWQYGAGDYDRKQAYAKAKLANLLFAFELDRRLAGTAIRSLAFDPGVVATNFARNNGLLAWFKHLVSHARRFELTTAATSASALVELASTRTIEPAASHSVFRNGRAVPACAAAQNDQRARELWDLSLRMTGSDLQRFTR